MPETITAVLERLSGQPDRFAELKDLLADVRWRRQLLDHADEVTRNKSARYEAAMRRRADFYAKMVRREGERFKGPEQMEAVDELVLQFPKILQAIETALGRNDAALLAVFAKYLALPLRVKSRVKEGAALFEQLLDKARLLDNRALQVIAGLRYGQFLHFLNRDDEAGKLLEQVSADAIAEGDEHSLAEALNSRGGIFARQCNLTDAIEYQERSLAIYRRLGNRGGEASALTNLGDIARMQYRYADAKRLLLEATGILRGVSDIWLNLQIQFNLASIARAEGNLSEAQHRFEEILRTLEGIGNLRGKSAALNSLAVINSRLGKYTKAEQYFRRVIQAEQMLGNRYREGCSLNDLASCLMVQGKFREASEPLATSLAIARELNNREVIAATLHGLAYSAYAVGNYNEALRLLEECFTISQEIGKTEFLGNHCILQSDTYYALGDYGRAEASAKRGLEYYREINDTPHVAEALFELAHICIRNGSISDSAGLLVDAMTTAKSAEDAIDDGMILTAGMILIEARKGGDSALMLYGFQHIVSMADRGPLTVSTNELKESIGNLAALLPPEELAHLKTQAETMSLEELTDCALKALTELQQELGAENADGQSAAQPASGIEAKGRETDAAECEAALQDHV